MISSRMLYRIAMVGYAIAPAVALAQVNTIGTVATNFLSTAKTLISIVFVLAVVLFGWGIVKFLIAAGDPAKIKDAKKFLLWGVVGMAVLASIFGLISYLQAYFGVTSGGGTIVAPTVQ